MFKWTCPIKPRTDVRKFTPGRHVDVTWDDDKKTWGVVGREMLEENKPGWYWCKVEDDGTMHRVPVHWSQMSLA